MGASQPFTNFAMLHSQKNTRFSQNHKLKEQELYNEHSNQKSSSQQQSEYIKSQS